jgi:hypothetical protein
MFTTNLKLLAVLKQLYGTQIHPNPSLSGRDIQHNISHSIIANNSQGAVLYSTAGEVNPIVTLERNQFNYNGRLLYGNFTTSLAAVTMNVQNTRNIFFKV